MIGEEKSCGSRFFFLGLGVCSFWGEREKDQKKPKI